MSLIIGKWEGAGGMPGMKYKYEFFQDGTFSSDAFVGYSTLKGTYSVVDDVLIFRDGLKTAEYRFEIIDSILKLSCITENGLEPAGFEVKRVSAFTYETSYASSGGLIDLANQGDAESQYNLGLIYKKGEDGVSQDIDEGFKWIKLAAKQNHPKALLALARFYVNLGNNEHIDINPLQAEFWAKKAVEQGNEDALWFLFGLYGSEFSEDKSDGMVSALQTLIARYDNPVAMVELGGIYCGSEFNQIITNTPGLKAYYNPKEGFELIEKGFTKIESPKYEHYVIARNAYFSVKRRTYSGDNSYFSLEDMPKAVGKVVDYTHKALIALKAGNYLLRYTPEDVEKLIELWEGMLDDAKNELASLEKAMQFPDVAKDFLEENQRQASYPAVLREKESEKPSKPKFCSSCGAPLMPEAVFCSGCGNKTDGTATTNQPIPQPPPTQIQPSPQYYLPPPVEAPGRIALMIAGIYYIISGGFGLIGGLFLEGGRQAFGGLIGGMPGTSGLITSLGVLTFIIIASAGLAFIAGILAVTHRNNLDKANMLAGIGILILVIDVISGLLLGISSLVTVLFLAFPICYIVGAYKNATAPTTSSSTRSDTEIPRYVRHKITCYKCLEQYDADMKSCPHCGHRPIGHKPKFSDIASRAGTEETWQCAVCHERNPSNFDLCWSCGRYK